MCPQRSRRISGLLALVWLLALADLIFTIWAHSFTPFYELNPLARMLLENGLLASLVLLKLVATGISSHIFWRYRAFRVAELALWASVLAYVWLALRWSDYTMGAVAMTTDL